MKKRPFVDDGRVIANMNVEGMPWYNGVPKTDGDDTLQNSGVQPEPLELTRKEKASLMRGVMGAALLVGLVFAAVFTLFILFCVFVWFK